MATRPAKRRKFAPVRSDGGRLPGHNETKIQNAFFRSAASWNLEQEYEAKPRKGKKNDRESGRLPIKTSDGRVQEVEAIRDDVSPEGGDNDWLNGDDDNGDLVPEADGPEPEEPQLPEHEQIKQAKEELAKIALTLNENPEENPNAFKALAKVGQSKIVAIKKLCMATQMAVYRDVIPGYRIRPMSEDATDEKLSKDVRRVRTYEHALVSGYQAYIRDLAAFAKTVPSNSGRAGQDISDLAITCACTLLTAVPHFNFRGELIQILVRKLSARAVDPAFVKCRKTLETLFQDDLEGRPSMEVVSVLAKMMKARDYQIDESILNLFLHLRLLSEFSGKASHESVDAPNVAVPNGRTKPKEKREFRTKRERKLLKERKALEKDMAQADALIGHEERDHMQSETLKLVFATYFRILKLRPAHLMGAVLEGLAKYAHLINQDFFGDLLEALKDMIRQGDEENEGVGASEDVLDGGEGSLPGVRNTSREALLCTVTAFTLLAGQDAHNARTGLHLDLSYFVTHLYRSLFPLSVNADLELGANSIHLPDPDNPTAVPNRGNKVNLQTTTVLLLRCLTAVLLPPWNIRSVPPLRLAAFSKQLLTASLHMPEKSCQAILALMNDVIRAHAKKIGALWNTDERKGDGTFNPLSETVEGSNPFAATIWEGEILRKHYCPRVREGAKLLEKSLATR